MKATFSILTRFLMLFIWNHTRSRKSKQPFQFWLVVEWFLHEILLDQANRSNLFNFESILNCFSMKSYQIVQIEATSANFTRFWILFVWNSTRPRKSKQPFQFWIDFELFFYEILPDRANRSNLCKFDPFLNTFCMKFY